jgi:PPOX class probable F420-dependent enzyme
VTYRRDGTPVGTPVLFALDHERILVRTAHDAGKLKRLAHTARIELAPSDSHGRRIGPASVGTARILGPGAVAPALAALHGKHRIVGPLFTFIRHRRGQRDVIIEITLERGAPMEVKAGEPMATAAPLIEAGTGSPAAEQRSGRALIRGTWVDMPTLALAAALFLGACSASAGTGAGPTEAAEADGGVAAVPTAVAATTDPAGQGPASDGPCAVLTKAQAEAALGEPVHDGTAKVSTTFDSATCRYLATGSTASIRVDVHPRSTRSDWEAQVAKVGLTPEMLVPGIGDVAYRADGSTHRPGVRLAAFERDHDLWVVIDQDGDPARMADAVATAARAALDTLR